MMSKGITYWPKVDHVYFWVRLLYHNRLSKVVFEEKNHSVTNMVIDLHWSHEIHYVLCSMCLLGAQG